VWALDQLAADGSALARGGQPLRIYSGFAYHFSDLALMAGAALAVAFLVQTVRHRRLPRRLGGALLLLGGGTLAAESTKLLLPRLLGALGLPFSFSLGFPSGHTTMAIALGLVPVLLVGHRWRFLAAAGAGLLGGALTFALFRGGFHSPADILGAACFTLALGFLGLGFQHRPHPEPIPLGRTLPALVTAGVGLGWGLSGLVMAWMVPTADPGGWAAREACDAGWRLAVGSALLAPGLVALFLTRSVSRGKLALIAILGALLWAGADGILHHARLPEAHGTIARDENSLRIVWLRQAKGEVARIGRSANWVHQGQGLRWAFVAQLPHRMARVDRSFQGLATSLREEDGRATLAAAQGDWSALKAQAEGLAAQVRTGQEPPPRAELERLLRTQAQVDASLGLLLRQLRSSEGYSTAE
jgi:membrane-associated phospholipid phosphatase